MLLREFLWKKKITNFLNCFLVIPPHLYLHIKNTKPSLGFNKHLVDCFHCFSLKSWPKQTPTWPQSLIQIFLPRIPNEFELVKTEDLWWEMIFLLTVTKSKFIFSLESECPQSRDPGRPRIVMLILCNYHLKTLIMFRLWGAVNIYTINN